MDPLGHRLESHKQLIQPVPLPAELRHLLQIGTNGEVLPLVPDHKASEAARLDHVDHFQQAVEDGVSQRIRLGPEFIQGHLIPQIEQGSLVILPQDLLWLGRNR